MNRFAMLTGTTMIFCASAGIAAESDNIRPYPTKAVRLVVPLSPGSGADIIARTLAERLSNTWGQKVFVENIVGGSGTIGSAEVAKSAPDGYTLLVNTSGHAVNPSLYKNLPYDPLKDFVDVAGLGSVANVLVVSSRSQVKSVVSLVELVKSKPGQLEFSSAGTATQLNAEKFKLATGLEIKNKSVNGGPEAILATETNRTTFFFSPISVALQPIHEGKVVALAVSSSARSSLLPDVPTIEESGVPGFNFTLWNGLWGPSKLPANVLEILVRDVQAALANPAVIERFKQLGIVAMQMNQSEFSNFVRFETEEYARIVKAAGMAP
jgi:tripartite-type tricarboxylate transporter receptor subunit TctC